VQVIEEHPAPPLTDDVRVDRFVCEYLADNVGAWDRWGGESAAVHKVEEQDGDADGEGDADDGDDVAAVRGHANSTS